MIILDKLPDDLCGFRQWLGRQVLFSLNAANRFPINEQDAFENAMLAHQVFRRRDFLIFLLFYFGKCVYSAG